MKKHTVSEFVCETHDGYRFDDRNLSFLSYIYWQKKKRNNIIITVCYFILFYVIP